MKMLLIWFALYSPPKAPRIPPMSAPACSNPVKAAKCGYLQPRRWK